MASIKDVAKHAGVSVTTVSRVLNNRGYIGKETRKKVEASMKALDYQPNQIARALLKNQSSVIGLIVPDISHPFFAELINWIESTASEHDLKVLVCNSLQEDRKSTRLNSSHVAISYAVFCLKKKKKKTEITRCIVRTET